jgi:hypothetical protein
MTYLSQFAFHRYSSFFVASTVILRILENLVQAVPESWLLMGLSGGP